MLRFLVFCSLTKMPFRWDKTRGGVQADFVGCFFDWENLVGGLSDKRAAWLVNWARTTAAAGIAVGRDCRAALGRFSFSTTLLRHLLPFLSPIYAWAAVIEDSAAWPLPPALIIILKWLADQVEQRHLVSLVQSTPVRAGLRFKADARAEGDTVIVGGYELPDGCNDLKKVRWFSYRLDTTNAPGAFEGHRQAFRAIAALELYASLLCLVLFAPCSDNGTRAELVLHGTTDNQSNEALVNRCLPPSIRATLSSLNSRSRCPDARSRWTFGGSLGMKISMLMILPTRLLATSAQRCGSRRLWQSFPGSSCHGWWSQQHSGTKSWPKRGQSG